MPVQVTVAAAGSRMPVQVQFWLLDWLRWTSRRVVPASVKRIVGVTPLSYRWLGDQAISPSGPRVPVWYHRVSAVAERWTSTS